jgi:hypothetical protein
LQSLNQTVFKQLIFFFILLSVEIQINFSKRLEK